MASNRDALDRLIKVSALIAWSALITKHKYSGAPGRLPKIARWRDEIADLPRVSAVYAVLTIVFSRAPSFGKPLDN